MYSSTLQSCIARLWLRHVGRDEDEPFLQAASAYLCRRRHTARVDVAEGEETGGVQQEPIESLHYVRSDVEMPAVSVARC